MSASIQSYFPMKSPARPGQIKALDFIQRMVEAGCQDIVIEAPTGAGKAAIGSTCCYWAANWPPQVTAQGTSAKAGGYYLVTQKALQTQIEGDVNTAYKVRDFSCLWSSASYDCDNKGFRRCQLGLRSKTAQCVGRKTKTCPYMIERARFNDTLFSLTNYPFFLTERIYVGALAVRNIMVLDECHTIEKQLLKFGEVELSDKLLREWDIRGVHVPEIDDKNDFADWLETNYLPKIEQQLADCAEMGKLADEEAADELLQRITALENQQRKVVECISGVRSKPDNWVYWCEQTEKDGNKAFCKPLDASPYMRILRSGATVRIYMSAFPGDKEPFCRSLGLEPDEVAWLRMKSSFPAENRPVVMGLVGSMSRKNQAQTLPALMRVIDKILTKHHDEKGVIHCHSYELGEKIQGCLAGGSHRNRVLFPKKAEDRDVAVAQHYNPKNGPTVLISPSMTEGFDFKDDAARWQIIAKVPYPYLGDKQVLAKKDQSQEWYDIQTIMAIVQAAGRICRSETDWGITYILDGDFKMLWEKRKDKFPAWFREAVVWS